MGLWKEKKRKKPWEYREGKESLFSALCYNTDNFLELKMAIFNILNTVCYTPKWQLLINIKTLWWWDDEQNWRTKTKTIYLHYFAVRGWWWGDEFSPPGQCSANKSIPCSTSFINNSICASQYIRGRAKKQVNKSNIPTRLMTWNEFAVSSIPLSSSPPSPSVIRLCRWSTVLSFVCVCGDVCGWHSGCQCHLALCVYRHFTTEYLSLFSTCLHTTLQGLMSKKKCHYGLYFYLCACVHMGACTTKSWTSWQLSDRLKLSVLTCFE